MQLGSKFNFNSSININPKNIGGIFLKIWQKTYMILFFLILTAFIAIGGYVWQQNVYSGEWNSEEKQKYINTQNKEIIFKENDFQKITDDIVSRRGENLEEYKPVKDIFKSY